MLSEKGLAMTDAALPGIALSASRDELESPARRAVRRLVKRKAPSSVSLVIVTFVLLALLAPWVRALRPDCDTKLDRRTQVRPPPCTGSAPTSSAATSARVRSMAHAPR